MADLAINKGATDLFGLGGNFQAQSSSSTTQNNFSVINGPDGDNCSESNPLDVTDTFECSYMPCSPTNLGTELDTALLASFGDVKNSKLIDSVNIRFSAGEATEITVRGHQHAQNPHTTAITFDGSGIVTTTTETFAVEDFLGIAELDSCVIAADLTFEHDHTDRTCGNGHHAVGESMNARCTLSYEVLGTVDTATLAAGWVIDEITVNDASDDFDVTQVQAHRYLTRN